MRIQEASQKTGISKRNIHFYMQKGLLTPETDPGNGYYSFSDEDCRKLILIRSLRNAGISVSAIRSILKTPSASIHYLHLRAVSLKEEIRRSETLYDSLQYLLREIPINPDLEDLYALCEKAAIPRSAGSRPDDEADWYDSDLVNQFLFRGFLGEKSFSDYQQYLWDKLNAQTAHENSEDYRKLYHFLQSLSIGQIDSYYARRSQNFRMIARMQTEDFDNYIETMKRSIRSFLNDGRLVARWKKNYRDFLLPEVRIYAAKSSRFVMEISPLFADYCKNINQICLRLYEWLQSPRGTALKTEMERTLAGHVNLEHCNHGELETLASFRNLVG